MLKLYKHFEQLRWTQYTQHCYTPAATEILLLSNDEDLKRN